MFRKVIIIWNKIVVSNGSGNIGQTVYALFSMPEWEETEFGLFRAMQIVVCSTKVYTPWRLELK